MASAAFLDFRLGEPSMLGDRQHIAIACVSNAYLGQKDSPFDMSTIGIAAARNILARCIYSWLVVN
jgi:hypothetical protein